MDGLLDSSEHRADLQASVLDIHRRILRTCEWILTWHRMVDQRSVARYATTLCPWCIEVFRAGFRNR